MFESRRTAPMYRVAWLIFLAAGSMKALGQQASLGVSSGSASAGGTASVNLSLNNLSGAAPTALEFTLGYPSASVTGVTLSTGASANAAGKILTCTSATVGQTSCLLYGDNGTVLGSGILATIGVSLSSKPGASIPLTLTSVSVSDANGEALSNSDSGGSITVNTPTPTLSSLACSPSSLTVAGSVLCTVSLSGAATSAVTVSLASNETVVEVPASIVINTPASSAQFTASVHTFTTAQSVVLTATTTGVSKTASLQLQPVLSPTKVTLGGNLGVGAGASDDSIALRSSSGQVLQTIASNTSGNFSFVGVTAGTYTVTPSKTGVVFSPLSRTVIVSSSNVAGINFTNQPSSTTVGKIVLDARVNRDQQFPSGTVTAFPFTTHAANELLLALVSTDSTDSPNTVVNRVTGGGLIWTLVVRANRQSGTSEIWRAFAKAPLSNAAVTAFLSQTVVSSVSVVSFTGVQATGTNGSSAIGAISRGYGSSGSPNASLTTTKDGSLVVGVGNDYDNAISRTPFAGQQLLHQDLSATGDTYWMQMLNATVPHAGTRIILGDSAPTSDQFNLAICEILPAGGN